MTASSRLLLKHPDLMKTTADLFAKLKDNPTLQSKFIDAPSGFFHDVSIANSFVGFKTDKTVRFLFNTLGNSKFQNWASSRYQKFDRKSDQIEQKMFDLARAFVEFGSLKGLNGHALVPDIAFTILTSISRTYAKTLNNSVTLITKIKIVVQPPEEQWEPRTAMKVVSVAEQLLHASGQAAGSAEAGKP